MTQTSLVSTRKYWMGLPADEHVVSRLAQDLNLHPLVARVMVARGWTDSVRALEFLQADRWTLANPLTMYDMLGAVTRIHKAVAMAEKVLIYGDYDVDGTCATAIVVKTLRKLGLDPEWFVPSRFRHGYGLHPEVVEQAQARGVSLIITVDTGITGYQALTRARELQMDVVVTDHHQIDTLPEATVVVHPGHPQGQYPFPHLCGAGVAFQLARALLDEFPEDLVELAGLATLADQVPLLGENRVLVREGLDRLRRAPGVAMASLLKVAGMIPARVDETVLAYQVAPRINAVGRLDDANLVVELLLTEDPVRADVLAKRVNGYNQRRQSLQAAVEEDALAQIALQPDWLAQPGLMVAGVGWHEGVIGIVAGKLASRFHRPTLCICVHDSLAKGSGRGIANFNLYQVLAQVQQESRIFTAFGGHQAAAGFSLLAANLEVLRDQFLRAAAGQKEVDVRGQRVCDAPLNLADVLPEVLPGLLRDLQRLAPFGQGNPQPVWFVKDAVVTDVHTMGKTGQHLKAWLKTGTGSTQPIVAFGYGDDLAAFSPGSRRHLLVALEENHWQGQSSLQLRLLDWK
ncbi:single-stranded-DNA-specific exonuclease RecJ [Alicyclobacillaceae bacterium I2511]|nr:single-stranded-DNA-specific exonuclease RecJ [Alicyclobacillaceae bacterium I2511]